jgi:hypothetical protein
VRGADVFSALNTRPSEGPDRVMKASIDHPYDIARPFLWIAAVGFATGFLGYMALFGTPL